MFTSIDPKKLYALAGIMFAFSIYKIVDLVVFLRKEKKRKARLAVEKQQIMMLLNECEKNIRQAFEEADLEYPEQ